MAVTPVNITGATTIVGFSIAPPFVTTDVYTFSFPYINQADFEITVNNETTLDSADYEFTSDYLIQLTTTGVDKLNTLYSALTAVPMTIRRRTQLSSRLVDYRDGATLTEADLDLMSNQLFYLIQEVYDSAELGSVDFNPVDGSIDFDGVVMLNVGYPTGETAAATLGAVYDNVITPDYTEGDTYRDQRMVFYSGDLYRANTDIVDAPAFNAPDWDVVLTAAQLTQIATNAADIITNATDIGTNATNIGTNASNHTSHIGDDLAHTEVDTKANLDTWAASASNGAQAFATDEKKAYQVVDGALVEIGGAGGAGDADTIHLIRAASDGIDAISLFSIDSPLPDFESVTAFAANEGDLSVPSSGSEAFLSNDDDHAVFKYTSETNSQFSAFGKAYAIPRGRRRKDAVIEILYRMADTSGDSQDADYMLWGWDKTNGFNTTTTSFGVITAGSDIVVADNVGKTLSVGQKGWFGHTGGTDTRIEGHLTSVVDNGSTWTIKFSKDVNLTSGDRFATGIVTDVLTTFAAYDDDTYKSSARFKCVVNIPEGCEELVIMKQQLTSETDSFLYFDNVLVSSEVTKRVFARGQSESCKFRGVAGYGSTNTVIPYYTNEDRNTLANHATVANDLTSGFSLTAKKKVRVVGSLTHNVDSGGADYYVGWTVNSNQLTTAVVSLTDQSTVEHQEYFRDNGVNSSTTTTIPVDVILNKGDVLRPHGDGVALGAFANYCSLTLTATPEVNDVVITESAKAVRNSHGAYITNNGATATLVSKSSNWITSVSRTSSGRVAVDWTILGLSQPPASITVTPRGYTGNQFLMVDAVTATGCDVRGDSDGGSNTDLDFNLSIEVHEDDAKDYDPLLAFPTITYGQEAEEYKATDWAGNGTGNLALPYFNNVQVNTVSNLGTVTNDSTEGCYFTATERCKVDGTVWLCATGNMYVGFSVNSDATQRDADIAAITDESVTLGYHHQSSNAVPSIYSVSEILNAGDVLYAHGISSRTPEATAARSGVKFVATPIHGVQNQAAIVAQPVAFVREVQSSGTNGGTFTSGAWRTRNLNDLSGDIAAVGVTLSSNQFTLPAGKYVIEAICPFSQTEHARAKIYNITDSKDIAIGHSVYQPTSTNGESNRVEGIVTITKSTSFEIQHRCSVTFATYGLGRGANFGVDEVFTQVKITRMK